MENQQKLEGFIKKASFSLKGKYAIFANLFVFITGILAIVSAGFIFDYDISELLPFLVRLLISSLGFVAVLLVYSIVNLIISLICIKAGGGKIKALVGGFIGIRSERPLRRKFWLYDYLVSTIVTIVILAISAGFVWRDFMYVSGIIILTDRIGTFPMYVFVLKQDKKDYIELSNIGVTVYKKTHLKEHTVLKTEYLKKRFIELYGEGGEIRFFAAPGRVNLIGEHIDYCGGKVLPAGLSLKCIVAARLRADNVINLAATTIDDRVSLDINKLGEYKGLKWGNYQAGMAYVMQNAGYKIPAMDMLYDCDVPFGSGLSSSAAIEVATGVAIALISKKNNESLGSDELVKIAVLAQKAENEYAGVSCGIMDQFASAMAKKDNAILLDCATLDYSYVPLKLGDYRLVIANSNKRRSLAEGKYNERRGECEEGLAILKKKMPNIKNLSEVTPRDLQQYEELLPSVVRQRVTHVVGECARVAHTAEALQNGEILKFGELLNQSHYSLRDLYEVTGNELDTLTQLARTYPGCIGSRMTGAGFGGCMVSLVHKDAVAGFIENVGRVYKEKIGLTADFYDASIEDGAGEVSAG